VVDSVLGHLQQPNLCHQLRAPNPCVGTLKIVRILIKHLHFFSNSGGPSDITPLDQLKPSMPDTSNLAVEDREGVYSAARACLLKLEQPGARYSPVFGNEFRQTVGELLASAERANDAASEMLKENGASKGKEEALVGLIKWVLWGE
jgi:hypothetical protein